jgi:hypothetical protein
MCHGTTHVETKSHTRIYQVIPTHTKLSIATYSSETLCSIEVSKGLERTGTNHFNNVSYKEKGRR